MASAYYNEFDPFAAAWLRELIKAGLIAPGIVDERSIEDVRPEELKDFTQCHFFAGVGVWSYALRAAGWPDDEPVWTGSCPCQPFSAAGKGAGFADERHLWPAFFHLIRHGKKQSVPIFGEQVASADGLSWIDVVHADLEGSGYTFGAVDTCAAGYGAPHIRQRLYWMANAKGARWGVRNANDQRPTDGKIDAFGDDQQTLWLDNAAGTRHVGAISQPKGLARHKTRLRLPDAGCQARGMANADGGDTSAEGQQRGGEHGQQQADNPAGQLADTIRNRLQGRAQHTLRGTRGGGEGHALGCGGRSLAEPQGQPGPVNGAWRIADWLFCRDGKWRPVEAGTFPLAYGAPTRVGRLRGYGNAINAAQAQGFIEAAIDFLTKE